MKKSGVTIVVLIIIAFILAFIGMVIFSYKHYSSRLTNINYAVQIGYNLCYFLIAFIVIIIAYNQLRKTREATNIQSLHDIFGRFISDGMKEKRMELATYILDFNGETFDDKIRNLKNKIEKWSHQEETELTDTDIQDIAIVKNKMETILYEFQIIGYFLKKDIFDLPDTYNLFSYELVRYWLLAERLGYIHYLRFNKINGEADFYESFQNLYKKCIRNEILVNIKAIKNRRQQGSKNWKSKRHTYNSMARKIISEKLNLRMFIYEESSLLNSD